MIPLMDNLHFICIGNVNGKFAGKASGFYFIGSVNQPVVKID